MGLDWVEIVMETEDHFEVLLPDAVFANLKTVADLQRTIVELIASREAGGSGRLNTPVYTDLVRIIAKHMRMDPMEIGLESRLVGDITRDG
jgi:hypothetical protein